MTDCQQIARPSVSSDYRIQLKPCTSRPFTIETSLQIDRKPDTDMSFPKACQMPKSGAGVLCYALLQAAAVLEPLVRICLVMHRLMIFDLPE